PLAPTYDFPLRKLAHIMEYSVLAILVFRAFELRIVRRQAVALAIVISVLYAILDEWHQMFVRGRQGAWQDIIIDIVGIAIIYMWLRTRKREPGKPEI
ncbi:MAG: VanZ family protein, partial [Candidatus Colwellbacteria bacterium]|nr:VanZ family protein [Candidatus Colwellbacteria bacterium]